MNNGVYEYGIVTKVATTTATIQFPDNSCFPTSGGVRVVAHSYQRTPFGLPSNKGAWSVESVYAFRTSGLMAALGTWYYYNNVITVPVGAWKLKARGHIQITHAGVANLKAFYALSTSTTTNTDIELSNYTASSQPSSTEIDSHGNLEADRVLASATPYYLIGRPNQTNTTIYFGEGNGNNLWVLKAELDYF